MTGLETIFSSNIPIDCYILKGRLETEGLDCFIFDENIVWVHPFKAVAIGGVKLKVPSDQTNVAKKILNLIKTSELIDQEGTYDLSTALENEITCQNEILKIKSLIRNDHTLLEKKNEIKSGILNKNEIDLIIDSEKKFNSLENKKINFSLKQFWFELFEADRNVIKYLRIRPIEFYLEKDIVSNYNSQSDTNYDITCPNCESRNVYYGYAIDYKWDFLYLILSLVIMFPIPMYRKNYHCYNCNFDFKYKRQQLTNANK